METEENSTISSQAEEHPDRASQIILQMASYQDVSMKDLLCILEDISENEVKEKVDDLIAEGKLLAIEEYSGMKFRRGK